MNRTIFAILALVTVMISSFAAINDLPVKTINGKKYYCYQVQPKETLYSLQHKLGVDRETIVRYNRSVEDGLRAHTMLYFPVEIAPEDASAASSPGGARRGSHEVKRGESIYGIARAHGCTVEEILSLNPSARDGIKAGSVLTLPSTASGLDTPEQGTVRGRSYTLENGETLYGIARTHGVTVDEILAANPDLSPTYYHGGQTIIIPDRNGTIEPSAEAPDSDHQAEVEYVEPETTPAALPAAQTSASRESADGGKMIAVEGVTIEEPESPSGADEMPGVSTGAVGIPMPLPNGETSIAVILPFMLSESKVSRSAQQYTEFLKGLLLAVDSLKNDREPITVYCYDSANSIDSVRTILRRINPSRLQMIIAPPDEAQMKMVANFGHQNGIAVFNPFVIKDNSYLTNPEMVQLNIPSAMMLNRVVEEVAGRYGRRIPVILHRSDGTGNQTEMVNALVSAFRTRGSEPVTINYNGQLEEPNLRALQAYRDNDFIFMSVDGKESDAATYLPGLAEYRESLDDPSRVMLFGYPEWITFKSDNKKNLSKVNTVIYSRFYADPDSYSFRNASEQFRAWYGTAPSAGYPRLGLLGIDLGMFVIPSLRVNDGDFSRHTPPFDGIQSCFRLSRDDGSQGLVNEALYLINFRPSGLIDRSSF